MYCLRINSGIFCRSRPDIVTWESRGVTVVCNKIKRIESINSTAQICSTVVEERHIRERACVTEIIDCTTVCGGVVLEGGIGDCEMGIIPIGIHSPAGRGTVSTEFPCSNRYCSAIVNSPAIITCVISGKCSFFNGNCACVIDSTCTSSTTNQNSCIIATKSQFACIYSTWIKYRSTIYISYTLSIVIFKTAF